MATVIPPRGKMTHSLETPYTVGDEVVLTADMDGVPKPYPGDTGTIRRIFVVDAKHGDHASFLVLDVAWRNFGRRMPVGESEIVPATKPADEAWLRKQLATLNTNKREGD